MGAVSARVKGGGCRLLRRGDTHQISAPCARIREHAKEPWETQGAHELFESANTLYLIVCTTTNTLPIRYKYVTAQIDEGKQQAQRVKVAAKCVRFLRILAQALVVITKLITSSYYQIEMTK
jgi:hypothetical protein